MSSSSTPVTAAVDAPAAPARSAAAITRTRCQRPPPEALAETEHRPLARVIDVHLSSGPHGERAGLDDLGEAPRRSVDLRQAASVRSPGEHALETGVGDEDVPECIHRQ